MEDADPEVARLFPLEDAVDDKIGKPLFEGVEPVIRIGGSQQLVPSVDDVEKEGQAHEQDEEGKKKAGNPQIALKGGLYRVNHCNLLLKFQRERLFVNGDSFNSTRTRGGQIFLIIGI